MEEMRVDVGGGRSEMRPVVYPANSKTGKAADAAREPIESVVTGKVVTRKKSLLSRATGSIVSDTPDSVGQYIVMEVMLPAAKSLIADVVTQGIERMLYGDSRGRSTGRPGYTNYNKMGQQTRPERRDISRRDRSTHNFDDVILANRGEAQDVLDGMKNLIDKYEMASVSDLYELLGITPDFPDDKWGWFSMAGSSIRPTRGGYLIKLPPTEPITN